MELVATQLTVRFRSESPRHRASPQYEERIVGQWPDRSVEVSLPFEHFDGLAVAWIPEHSLWLHSRPPPRYRATLTSSPLQRELPQYAECVTAVKRPVIFLHITMPHHNPSGVVHERGRDRLTYRNNSTGERRRSLKYNVAHTQNSPEACRLSIQFWVRLRMVCTGGENVSCS